MGMKRIFAVAATSLLLAGCAQQLSGPPATLYANGVNPHPLDAPPGTETWASNSIVDFEKMARISDAPEAGPDQFTEYRDAGFELVHARCVDFFRVMRLNQSKAHVVRDAVAPLQTLGLGLLALNDVASGTGVNDDWTQVLQLGSSAVLAGVTVYERNFLFGADNIDAVRVLTEDALAEHRRVASSEPLAAGSAERRPRKAESVYEARRRIRENQQICMPGNILSLAQAAIKAGKVKGTQDSKPGDDVRTLSGGVDAGYAAAVAALVAELRPPFDALSPDQVGALWAVLSGEGSDLPQILFEKLLALGDANPLEKVDGVDGAPASYRQSASWTADRLATARAALTKLSPAMIEGFRGTLAQLRIAAGAGAAFTLPRATEAAPSEAAVAPIRLEVE
jgi:hypothetical protein